MNVCEEAMSVVLDRQSSYGTPENNFKTIATMWNAFLAARPGGSGAPITASDVALLMITMKVARHANRPKRDNIVDIAGYALTAETVDEANRPAEPAVLPPPAYDDHAIHLETFREMHARIKDFEAADRAARGLPVVGSERQEP